MLRLFPALTVLLLLGVLAEPAAGQGATARGVVLNAIGDPVPSALVTATQPDTSARRFQATTDQNGEWVMLGLTNGEWEFSVEAQGFAPEVTEIEVRLNTPLVTFVLAAPNAVLGGSLPTDILLRIDVATAARNNGDLEGAARAFEALRDGFPELGMVNMVLAGIYREQAADEDDLDARLALLRQADAAYSAVLQRDGDHARARLELGATQAAAGDLTAAAETFEALIAARPGTPTAADAASRLAALGGR